MFWLYISIYMCMNMYYVYVHVSAIGMKYMYCYFEVSMLLRTNMYLQCTCIAKEKHAVDIVQTSMV